MNMNQTNNKIVISIITPCYNAAPYIATTIKSVQQQTFTDWEMIVVDDGSTDNSAHIVSEIAEIDSRIKLIQKENGGSASARKLGLSLAQGEYIQFLDADDQIEKDKLRRQIALMQKQQLQVSYTDWCFIHSDGKREQLQGLNFNRLRVHLFWGTLFGALPVHAFVYRRDFLKEHDITFNSEIQEREDWNFHIHILSHHPRIKRIKGYCGALYLRCPTSKTSSFEKIQMGTLRFLLYKIRHTHFLMRLLLLMRLSIVLVELIMPTLKRKINIRNIIPLFFTSFANIIILFIAVLLLPMAIIIFLCKITWANFNRYFQNKQIIYQSNHSNEIK